MMYLEKHLPNIDYRFSTLNVEYLRKCFKVLKFNVSPCVRRAVLWRHRVGCVKPIDKKIYFIRKFVKTWLFCVVVFDV